MTYSYPTQPLPLSEPASAPAAAPRRSLALVVGTALLAGAVGAGAGAGVVLATTDDSVTTITQAGVSQGTSQSTLPSGSVSRVASDVLPSVVSILFTNATGGGSGSGVVLDTDGLILTNNHVVEGAEADGGSLSVTFADGTSTSAEIVGTDPTSDLAVIQVNNVKGLVPATLGSSDALRVGETVVAIGSPLGLSGTVTTGIVSAKNRPVTTGAETGPDAPVLNAVQTDAAINPGNSGGALVNLKGEVVGINSAIATLGGSMGDQSGSIGLGFAIPIDQARWVVPQLVDTGEATHAYLGVTVGDATGEVRGAELQSVEADTPADAAGLKTGDVVTGFEDQAIDGRDALVAAVRSTEPGTEVTLTYMRSGDVNTITATITAP